MREIAAVKIKDAVAALCEKAAWDLPQEVEAALNEALKNETSELGREILRELIKNAEIARRKKVPLCQDTGMACVFIKLGQEVQLAESALIQAVNDGVKLGYKNLRKSMLHDPFNRENTKDNTPANLQVEIVPGDELKITVLLKGGGAENASCLKMFLPTATKEEIIKFIVKTVRENGPKACPPLILGIGIGGSFDTVATLAKKALLRPLASHSTKHDAAKMEAELLQKINATGVGPMGIGGITTALAVHIETAPCHIASLPVAINFQCHSHRYGTAVL